MGNDIYIGYEIVFRGYRGYGIGVIWIRGEGC